MRHMIDLRKVSFCCPQDVTVKVYSLKYVVDMFVEWLGGVYVES